MSREHVAESRAALTASSGAALGGVLWAVKGSYIGLTGREPAWVDLLFTVAPFFFAIALLGLRLMVGVASRPARVGGWFCYFAAGASVFEILYGAFVSSKTLPFNLGLTAATVAVLASLILLGVALRRADVIAAGGRFLPLALGAAALPLLLLGGALATLSARLVELPIVLLGFGWVGVALVVWSRRETA